MKTTAITLTCALVGSGYWLLPIGYWLSEITVLAMWLACYALLSAAARDAYLDEHGAELDMLGERSSRPQSKEKSHRSMFGKRFYPPPPPSKQPMPKGWESRIESGFKNRN